MQFLPSITEAKPMADMKSEIEDGAEKAHAAVDAVEDGVESARKRFQKLGDQAQDRYKKVSDDVQDRYKKVSDDVRRGAERASKEIRRGTERARETYGEVAENATKTYERVRSEAGNVTREVSLYVRDNPAKAVMIAAGFGFLLGLVARRGRRDDEA
jgi:ElaB/YqjD/DUF883 family membrane-anchored ribosome-binding protein